MTETATPRLDQWLDDCVDALAAHAAQLNPTMQAEVSSGLAQFRDERVPAAEGREPSSLPVVDEVLRDDGTLPASLSELFVDFHWEPTFRATDEGCDYALAILTDRLGLSTTQAGVMLVGDQRQYPVHAHPPAEVYLVLHGTGKWRSGGSETYVAIEPGAIVVNRRGDTHSVIADAGPVAALFVLWP